MTCSFGQINRNAREAIEKRFGVYLESAQSLIHSQAIIGLGRLHASGSACRLEDSPRERRLTRISDAPVVGGGRSSSCLEAHMNALHKDVPTSANMTAACALCESIAQLRRSHCLPSATYKHLQDPGDPTHIILSRGNHYRTSKQVKDYLLCDACENKLSKQGEQWVVSNGFHASGTFPLHTALKNAKPLANIEGGDAFSGRGTPGVEIEKLVYFAASVFWRAAVHDWGFEERLLFGSRYEEELRRYLMGRAAFPVNAALVVHVSDTPTPLAIATFPVGGKVDGAYHRYHFRIPGLLFTLFLGQRIPSGAPILCAVRSPERMVFLSNKSEAKLENKAVDMMADLFRAAKP